MKTAFFTGLVLFWFLPFDLSAQCDPLQTWMKVVLKTDAYPNETHWKVFSQNGRVVGQHTYFPAPHQVYVDSFCVDKNACLEWVISDLQSDGICCDHGDGYFEVYLNGRLLTRGGTFGAENRQFFNCSVGDNCLTAKDLTVGNNITRGLGDEWYRFVPDVSGRYTFSTCYPENTCNTVIWVYGYCDGLIYDHTNRSALFYNDDYCGEQAQATALLEAGKPYLIRIGGRENTCDNLPIHWTVQYEGQISGCTDVLACNYNPVATIDDLSCRYAGDPDCPDGPDLTLDEQVLKSSLERKEIHFDDSCLREEGCLKGYGNRTIINFSSKIINIGTQDFFLGIPPKDPANANETWEWDACHRHWHYEGYAEYLLFDEFGQNFLAGFKNGFCVYDNECAPGVEKKFTCELQGLTAGCSDIYESFLPCQWIDITDVPPGKYTLVNRVNWDFSPDALGRYETDYSNNWAQVCIEIFRDSATGYVGFDVHQNCPRYIDCAGTPNGLATYDCEGVCQGKRITGDLLPDTLRNSNDVLRYIDECLNDTLRANYCNDLNRDGRITVTDASLILECVLHANAPPLPGHGHAPCEFPFSVTNRNDSVWLSIGEIVPSRDYFDLAVLSPYGKIAAFELSLSGVSISNVHSLTPLVSTSIYHDSSEILGISFEEDFLPKTNEWLPLLRVFFAALTDDEVCVQPGTTFVNDIREEMNFVSGDCREVMISPVSDISVKQQLLSVFPNPARDIAYLLRSPSNSEPAEIQLIDLTGSVVRTIFTFQTDPIQLPLYQLPAGLYTIRVRLSDQILMERLMVN